jgi:hypothetical protein
VPKHALLTAAALLVTAAPLSAAFQASPDGATSRRREFPLNCRGGDRLAFDTLAPLTDTATRVRLSLRYTGSVRAAGWKGEGLAPSTCAWVDRPLNAAEPLRVRVTLGIGDSMPRLTLRDTSLYWSFLASDSDSGYFEAAGYRLWFAGAGASPAPRMEPAVQTPAPQQRSRFRFDVRHLPLYALGWMLIVGLPAMTLLGAWSGWRRFAALYPSKPVHGGRRLKCGLIMRVTHYRSGVRLTADGAHLHFSVVAPFRPGHRPFSVPWSDVVLSRDEWPWFPFKGLPVIRLTLAREPGIRILVQKSVGEGIMAASGGRLTLAEAQPPTLAAR